MHPAPGLAASLACPRAGARPPFRAAASADVHCRCPLPPVRADAIRGRGGPKWNVEPQRALACTLYWLASGCFLRVAGDAWGLHASTVLVHVRACVAALDAALCHLVSFPTDPDSLRDTFAGFETISTLPLVAAAVDGCLLPLARPFGAYGFRYHCYKKFYALTLLATCNAALEFTFIDARQPGCVGDAAAFNNSKLFKEIDAGLFSRPSLLRRLPSGAVIGPYIVADSAFALHPNVMKCFDEPAYGTPEFLFNYAVIRARRVIENAFGMLQARWQVLRRAYTRKPDWHESVIIVCCLLHNFCQRRGMEFNPAWAIGNLTHNRDRRRSNSRASGAELVRTALVNFLQHSRTA